MKLTIEHLKGYLGTGLDCQITTMTENVLIEKITGFDCKSETAVFGNVENKTNGVGLFGECKLLLYRVKPLLYPLSSLTEYREDLGFVPIEWLRENVSDKLMFSDDRFIDYDDGKDKNVLHYSLFDVYSHSIGIDEILKLTQKLQEWHFDIHNLIENNLAIDKRTIKK